MTKATSKVRSTMALLSAPTHRALTEQANKMKRIYGGRAGRAVIIRGVMDGVVQAGMDFSDTPSEYQIAERVRTALLPRRDA